MKKKDSPVIGLCFRCEWRAQFFETERHPRRECGEIEKAKFTCYMFQPCKPVVVDRTDKKDPRPLSANYFSCRFKGVRIGDMELTERKEKDGTLLYWRPLDA